MRGTTGRPSTVLQNPRLYGTNSPRLSTARKYQSQLQNRIVHPIPSPLPLSVAQIEPNQLQQLIKLFHTFVDQVTILTTHNGANYSFRTVLSQECSDVESAFGNFFKRAMQQCGTMSVLQQGVKPGLASSTSSLRKTALPFLRKWHGFAQTIIDTRITGPGTIFEEINLNSVTVLESLDEFLKVKSHATTVHDSSVRLCKQYQQQIRDFQKEIIVMGTSEKEQERVKQMCTEIAEFSRRLNESFQKDFVACGLSNTDLMMLKNRAYGACSDIIHGLRASLTFSEDIQHVLRAFDSFQDLLAIILERLNLPTKYLFYRDSAGPSTPRSDAEVNAEEIEDDEEEDEFGSDLDIFGVLDKGSELMNQTTKGDKTFDAWVKAIKHRARHIVIRIEDQRKELKQMELKNDTQEKAYEEMLEAERATNTSMSQEIDRLNEEIYHRDREIKYLRSREQDNEFKKCLRDVARQLGGVMKEETVNFDEDDDDDQLIQYVNALSVYVVEKKCAKCDRYAEREFNLRGHINHIVTDMTDDSDLVQAAEKAAQKWDDVNAVVAERDAKIRALEAELAALKGRCNEVCQVLQKDNVLGDIGRFMVEAVKDKLDDHKEEIAALNKRRLEEQLLMASKFKNLFTGELEEEIDTGSKIDDTFLTIETYIKKHKETEKELAVTKSVCDATKHRLMEILHVEEEPVAGSVGDTISALLTIMENTPNPLKPLVAELEMKHQQAIGSIHILANRLRGLSGFEASEETVLMTTRELTKHTFEMLDIVHDKFEKSGKLAADLEEVNKHTRTTLESLVVKMQKYAREAGSDLSKLDIHSLTKKAVLLCEKITKPSVSNEFITISEVNSMFKGIMSLAPVSSTSDPRRYIPEICASIISLNNSIMALKPFSSALNDMFSIVDFKEECFEPDSPKFDDVQEKAVELHRCLKQLSPLKVNALLFTVLERFTTLTWTFLDVAAGKRSEAFITRENL